MKETDTSTGYVHQLESRLVAAYMHVLSETDAGAVDMLNHKRQIQAQSDKKQRMQAYKQLWEGLDEGRQWRLASHDAKINHLARLARVRGTTEIVQAHNSIRPGTAGSIDFVLEKMRENGVAAGQVQRFIDENAVAWFSLTGHPTNPTTVAYTMAQTRIAAILADDKATRADLESVLRVLRDTDVVGAHKTPLEEAEEILNTLDVIFDTALAHKKLFEDALATHGYAAEGVVIRTPLIRPCVWTLGDGDGNDNMTAEVLEQGIALHRQRIAARYMEHAGGVPFLEQGIKNATLTPADAAGAGFHDLAYLLSCFGHGFAAIDIRHNAADIIATVDSLARLSGLPEISPLADAEQALLLASWLDDAGTMQKFSTLSPPEPSAARIFGRLQVAGRSPGMCEKLIIAETTCPAHALAALLLLKATGNADEAMDVVTLSESVDDLLELGNITSALLSNDTYRRHVMARGKLVVMIAKSDTTRQDGRGEAEFAQYEAAVDVYRTLGKMQLRYPDLEHVRVSVKNGGGHALQRGGGRITEIPAVHGRAAADARVTDIGPSTLTIQGQQMTILFCPGKTALGTLEALAAQNLYTKAGIQGEMPQPRFSQTVNRQYAQADAWLYARAAGRAFDALTRHTCALDELLVRAPWLAMKAGNVSSRPAKRGEKQVAPGITPREAKGDDPKALQGRAISGERLTAHACLPVFSVLGLAEAMEAVQNEGMARRNPEKYGDALHHLYRAHKIQRDGARATVNAAAMADFDIAWPLLAGRERPPAREVSRLAAAFKITPEPGANAPEITLAFLEDYFLRVEKLCYEMVSGQKPKNMRHGDALRKLWPELAQQVAGRDRNAEFARVIECHRTALFDSDPDRPLSEKTFRITQALYAAANVINAPVGILATRTRLEPVQETGLFGRTHQHMRPESYGEKEVEHLLKFPDVFV